MSLTRVSYTQFVTRATQVVVQGLAEGWIVADIPPAPTDDDAAYGLHFVDPERWAEALLKAFEAEGLQSSVDQQPLP